MNIPGGTRGVLDGNLKRRLLSNVLANITFGEPTAGSVTLPATVTGLSDCLSVWVGVSAVLIDDTGNRTPLPAAQWPAGAGTLQITPQSYFGDAPKGLFRPVFQDPSQPINENHPLPQDLPFSWNFPGECDEALIEVTLDKGAWAGFGRGGIQIMLQVFVEFTGSWWDVKTIELALGQVAMIPVTRPVEIVAS